MSASKDKDHGTWIAYIRYKDWMGKNQVHKKRGVLRNVKPWNMSVSFW